MLSAKLLNKVFSKKIIKSVSLLFFSFLIFFIFFSKTVKADENDKNFDIKLESTYQVNANGKTLVTLEFNIRNLSPEYFISRYGIIVSSTNIENIKVTDNGSSLEPQVNKLTGQTSIGISFEEEVLGEGKNRELIISYLDGDIANISGKILEVNIPALADPEQYDEYQLNLLVPNIFGPVSRISPSDFTVSKGSDFDTFNYNNLQGQAVSAIFGDKQIFDLRLSYHLNNPNNQNALTQITLPPETPNQRIHYHSLNPLPKSMKVDADGNFIATYEVPANNSYQVELLAQILLSLQADPNIQVAPVLPAHLSGQKFWEIDNPELIEAAIDLNNASDINQFVVNTLDYTEENLDGEFYRLGAANSFLPENRIFATCQEFTDLFVALARIKQIPAKRMVGYAYSNNEELRPISVVGDVLHAWPSFYDVETKSWREIDPTWQKTTGGIDYFSKFDLNHLVFAINGVSSVLPYPAGSYQLDSQAKEKKIFVEFSQGEFPNLSPELNLSLNEQKFFNITIPGKYTLVINNPTGQVWYFNKFSLVGEKVIINQEENWPELIIPFQELIIPLSVYNKDGLIGTQSSINIDIQLSNNELLNYEFTVKGLGKIELQNPEKIIYMVAGFIVLALITGSLFLLGRKLTSALRRQGQKSEKKDQELHSLSSALSEDQTVSRDSQNSEGESPSKRTSGPTDRS
jgi:transglutaminase-like putative cysteine protease